ncbi:MAG TPA: DinB family protein [Gemmatimonadaceae bacterium]|nr:DinB family protein [Gemmatimonadaceae bacterium]
MKTNLLAAFCGLVLFATSSPAQSGGPNVLEGLRGGFDEVHTAVSKSVDLVPADKYTYRPVATVRTFGELVAHVADSYAWYCSRASGRDVQWSDAIEKGKTDKATVTQKLRESLAVCTAAYGNGSSNLGGLMANIAHTNLHYGNIITYLRMLGLVPPSSG